MIRDTSPEEKQKVLEKIRKLLNISNTDNGASIGEIENAMSSTQRLLHKYHLSMSEALEYCEEESSTDQNLIFEFIEKEAVSYKANDLPKWLGNLVLTVNEVTQTKTLIKRIPRPGKTYSSLSIVFVGDSIDVSVSIDLFAYLKETTSELANKHIKEIDGKFKQWRSFVEGCTVSLYDRSRLENIKYQPSSTSIENNIITDEEMNDIEFEEDDLDGDEEDTIQESQTSIELFNKYKDEKINKINDFISDHEIKDEPVSKVVKLIDEQSYESGIHASKSIPLKVYKKVSHKKQKGARRK